MMSLLSLPSLSFSRSSFGLESNTQTFKSPLTGQTQTIERPGARWKASYTLPPMKRQRASVWQAFLLKLRGGSGRFYGVDPDAITPAGSALSLGSGALIDGAGQSGSVLATKNWKPSENALLKAGDYLAYDTATGRSLHCVTADVASDSSGKAQINIEPPMRTAPPDGAVLILSHASCQMGLLDNSVSWEVDACGVYRLSFQAEERF